MSQDNSNWQQQVWQQPPAQPAPPRWRQPYAYQPAPPEEEPRVDRRARGRGVGVRADGHGHVVVHVRHVRRPWGPSGLRGSSDADYLTPTRWASSTSTAPSSTTAPTAAPEGLKAQLDRAARQPPRQGRGAARELGRRHGDGGRGDGRVRARVLRGDGKARGGVERVHERERRLRDIVAGRLHLHGQDHGHRRHRHGHADHRPVGAAGEAGHQRGQRHSSDSKDSSYGTRPLTEEERAYYQTMVDQINETFIQTVAEGRGMTEDEVRALATGLTFTGMEAVENGLADEMGTQGGRGGEGRRACGHLPLRHRDSGAGSTPVRAARPHVSDATPRSRDRRRA